MYFNRRRISSLAYILVNLYQQFELFLCPAFPLVFFKLVDLLSFSSFHLFLAVLDLHCCMGFSLVMVNGGYSLAVVNEVLMWWLLLLWSPGSRWAGFSSCQSWALEHRLNSYGTWAQLLHGMWDLPTLGIEPMSPASAGRFFTTEPPEKPCGLSLHLVYSFLCCAKAFEFK